MHYVLQILAEDAILHPILWWNHHGQRLLGTWVDWRIGCWIEETKWTGDLHERMQENKTNNLSDGCEAIRYSIYFFTNYSLIIAYTCRHHTRAQWCCYCLWIFCIHGHTSGEKCLQKMNYIILHGVCIFLVLVDFQPSIIYYKHKPMSERLTVS